MADRAFITPAVLRWARETARLTHEAAAAKVPVKVERLQAWEEGTAQPTINQAQTLAKAYRRPFALFFLPEPPYDFTPLQDFRKPDARELGTGSVFIIREIQQKQAWMSETAEEAGETPLSFVGSHSTADAPAVVAADILRTFDIQPGVYPPNGALKVWIDAAERAGIFVSRTSFIHSKLKLDSEELQGFAIADSYAPFVFINSEDWPAAQLFTLVHELAHIWIAATGISAEIVPTPPSQDGKHPVEQFCNEVAAAALMPSQLLQAEWRELYTGYETVQKLSRMLGVSSYALLVRGLNLGMLPMPQYQRLKAQAETEYALYLQREGEKKAAQKEKEVPGGPNPYLLRVLKNSRLFTQIVLDAFRGGNLQPTEASALLNTPVNKFRNLEAIYFDE